MSSGIGRRWIHICRASRSSRRTSIGTWWRQPWYLWSKKMDGDTLPALVIELVTLENGPWKDSSEESIHVIQIAAGGSFLELAEEPNANWELLICHYPHLGVESSLSVSPTC